MTLSLDAETLAELGWGDARDAEDGLAPTRMGGRPSRTEPGQVDGRSRRNWRRKAAQATQGCKSTQDAGTTQAHLQQEPA